MSAHLQRHAKILKFWVHYATQAVKKKGVDQTACMHRQSCAIVVNIQHKSKVKLSHGPAQDAYMFIYSFAIRPKNNTCVLFKFENKTGLVGRKKLFLFFPLFFSL